MLMMMLIVMMMMVEIWALIDGDHGNTVCAFMNSTGVEEDPAVIWDNREMSNMMVKEGIVKGCTSCHAITSGDKVVSQGCWLSGEGCSPSCNLRRLIADTKLEVDKRRLELDEEEESGLSFCCCTGDMCNVSPVKYVNEEVVREPSVPEPSIQPYYNMSDRELVWLSVLVILLLLLAIVSFLLHMQSKRQRRLSRNFLSNISPDKKGVQIVNIEGSQICDKKGDNLEYQKGVHNKMFSCLRPVQTEDKQNLLVGMDVEHLLLSPDIERENV